TVVGAGLAPPCFNGRAVGTRAGQQGGSQRSAPPALTAVDRPISTHRTLLYASSPAASRSSIQRVPCSRPPLSSYPPRNTPCSVSTRRVPSPSGLNSSVSSETEIFRSPIHMS